MEDYQNFYINTSNVQELPTENDTNSSALSESDVYKLEEWLKSNKCDFINDINDCGRLYEINLNDHIRPYFSNANLDNIRIEGISNCFADTDITYDESTMPSSLNTNKSSNNFSVYNILGNNKFNKINDSFNSEKSSDDASLIESVKKIKVIDMLNNQINNPIDQLVSDNNICNAIDKNNLFKGEILFSNDLNNLSLMRNLHLQDQNEVQKNLTLSQSLNSQYDNLSLFFDNSDLKFSCNYGGTKEFTQLENNETEPLYENSITGCNDIPFKELNSLKFDISGDFSKHEYLANQCNTSTINHDYLKNQSTLDSLFLGQKGCIGEEIISKNNYNEESYSDSMIVSNTKLTKKVILRSSSLSSSHSLKTNLAGLIQLKIFSTPKLIQNENKGENELFPSFCPDVPIKTLTTQINCESSRLLKAKMDEKDAKASIAKISIFIDPKNACTNLSILSSNNTYTLFKSNTCDMVKTVSGITESEINELGLKKDQLLDTTVVGQSLLDVYSFVAKKKFGENWEPVMTNHNNCIEIIHYAYESPQIQSAKSSSINLGLSASKRCQIKSSKVTKKTTRTNKYSLENTLNRENVGISLGHRALPTMVAVPSVLDALSASSNSKLAISEEDDDSGEIQISSTKCRSRDKSIDDALLEIGINHNSLKVSYDDKNSKFWACPIASCGKELLKLSSLKVHILHHKGLRPFKCHYDDCDWSFYTRFKLKRHLETHLKRKDFVCEEEGCNRRFTTIYNLKTHLKTHKTQPTYSCPQPDCLKSFPRGTSLELHMRTHDEIEPSYNCDVEGCNKAYYTSNSLLSHMRHHTAASELVCDWEGCGKKFRQPSRYKSHVRLHTGHRPYACTFEGCNAKFFFASKLSRHKKTHTNDRRFSCLICKKSFLRSEHLRDHVLTHTGVKNFHCTFEGCNAKFAAKSSLYVHLRKHKTPQKSPKSRERHRCQQPDCHASFKSKYELRLHLLNHPTAQSSDTYGHSSPEKPIEPRHFASLLSEVDLAAHPQNAFIDLSLTAEPQSSTSVILDSSQALDKTPCLSVTDIEGSNMIIVPDGLFTLADCDSFSATSDFELGDLARSSPASSSKHQPKKTSDELGSARTDFFGNVVLSQKAKKRLKSSLSRKTNISSGNTQVTCSTDPILEDRDITTLSLAFQPSILSVDGITDSLYSNQLISRELSTECSQSTINLRDIE